MFETYTIAKGHITNDISQNKNQVTFYQDIKIRLMKYQENSSLIIEDNIEYDGFEYRLEIYIETSTNRNITISGYNPENNPILSEYFNEKGYLKENIDYNSLVKYITKTN